MTGFITWYQEWKKSSNLDWISVIKMEHKRISQEFEAMNDIETDICNFLIWGKDDSEYDKRLTSAWRKQEKME